MFGFNKKKAEKAQQASAARTTELGRMLALRKAGVDAAADAELQARDDHGKLLERITLARKQSAAHKQSASRCAALFAGRGTGDISRL